MPVFRNFPDSASLRVVQPTAGGAGAASANAELLNNALASGGTILLPIPGTYYINSTLRIPSNAAFIGAPGVVIKSAPGMNAPVLRNADRSGGDSHITIADLTFDGDHANQTVAFSTVDLSLVTYFWVERCVFKGGLRTGVFPRVSSNGEGLVLRQCQFGHVTGCHAEGNVYDGFKTRQSSDIIFTSITAKDNGRSGIQLAFTHNSRLTPSERITVNGLTTWHSTGAPTAPSPTTSGVYIHGANHCVLNNIVSHGPWQGIGLTENSCDNVFGNVVIRQNYGGSKAGIHLEDNGAGSSADRNMFNNVNLQPLSGESGRLIRIEANCSNNAIRNVSGGAGGGSGIWTVEVAGASAARNQFSDGLLTNYSLADAGTATGFSNWIGF
jgi:hypothetical protein